MGVSASPCCLGIRLAMRPPQPTQLFFHRPLHTSPIPLLPRDSAPPPNLACALPTPSPRCRNKLTRGRSLYLLLARLRPSSPRLADRWCSTMRPWARCAPCSPPVSMSGGRRRLGLRLVLVLTGQPLRSQSSSMLFELAWSPLSPPSSTQCWNTIRSTFYILTPNP